MIPERHSRDIWQDCRLENIETVQSYFNIFPLVRTPAITSSFFPYNGDTTVGFLSAGIKTTALENVIHA